MLVMFIHIISDFINTTLRSISHISFDCPTFLPHRLTIRSNRIFTYICRDNKSFCIMHYKAFSEYDIAVSAPGFDNVNISGSDMFSGELSIQNVKMSARDNSQNNIVIPVNTLYGDYPPKIDEEEIKPMGQSGEIVLDRVVVPEIVVVHDGPPKDTEADNYYVTYKDYIKNVASSEIYSTWPRQTIEANVLAIMSFTLNRVYTEWYRNKFYDFTITSSTAYDQKWVNGRNVFESISQVVDDIFDNYISRPNVKQPILTQYCDGKRVTCPNRLSQWGSTASSSRLSASKCLRT